MIAASTQSRSSERRILLAGLLWVAVYFAARIVLKEGFAPGLRIGAALAPVAPFAWWLRILVRGVGRLDELQRRVHLEALVVAFPLTFLLLLTLGLLELATPLSPDDWSYRHVWAYLPLFYLAGLALAWRRYR
jgi:hypothetical protein